MNTPKFSIFFLRLLSVHFYIYLHTQQTKKEEDLLIAHIHNTIQSLTEYSLSQLVYLL